MNYDSRHTLAPFPSKLLPSGGSYARGIFDMVLAGVGTQSPTPGIKFTPGMPPQSNANALLTHPVATGAGTDCPTCNLVEIPYNPTLPVLTLK